jgi:flavin-dependent dehydrogenase
VGGGPAGAATAAALRRRGRSVALFERTAYDRARVGETIGAEALAELRALGAWEPMQSIIEEQVPQRAVRSSWGSPELVERHAMAHPFGEGRHVDRARFDAALAAWAEAEGAVVARDAGACVVRKSAGSFRVEPARGGAVSARSFVDASGRGAPASATLDGRRWLALDRQIAIVARFRSTRALGWDLLLEAVEDGYWYSAPQPDDVLVAALVTDADLAITHERADMPRLFRAAMLRAPHTASRCAEIETDGPPRIVRADSGCLVPDGGAGWCAVGDAAFARDPLAGDGVARALRSAATVARRIDAALGTDATIDLRDSELAKKFADYTDRRASYYAMESRWTDAPFWARRRPIDWRAAPITLAPTEQLRVGEAHESIAARAAAEALVPPRAIAAGLAAARMPVKAHVILETIRDAAPLDDKRLLVGLQLLVESGALEIAL